MKSDLLKLLMFASKQIFYIFIVQLVAMQLLVAANSSSQSLSEVRLSLHLENMPLEKVFHEIEKETNFNFTYNHQLKTTGARINLTVSNGTLREVLETIATNTQYNFRRINQHIYAIPRRNQASEISVTEEETAREVKGKVTDAETGESLPGASIIVKGTTHGTTTDIEGNYVLALPSEATALIVSYIGYESKEIAVGAQAILDIQLSASQQALNEVVVVGYGSQAVTNITSSVSSISGDQLEGFQVASFTEALAGMSPGVQVNQTTGAPGEAPSIRIRGVGSITAGNEPLYVIDGFPLGNDALSSFSMNDIESITVLKDASATSIYGSRGSNGVVLVTTKKGKIGTPQVVFNGYYGVQEVNKRLDVLSPEEYVAFANDAKNNAWAYLDNDPNDPNEVRPSFYQTAPYYDNTEDWVRTDWHDEIFEVAPIQDYQLAVSGGSEAVRYRVSGEYFNQDGIIKNSYFKRYNLGTNIDLSLTSKLRLSLGLNGSKIDNKKARDEGQFNNGVVGSAINLPGFFDTQNEDGSYPDFWGFGHGVSSVRNPMAFINEYNDYSDQFRLLGNVSMEYDIIEGLSFKSLLGFDHHNVENNSFQKSFDFSVPAFEEHNRGTTPANGSYSSSTNFNWLFENTLHYNTNWNNDHHVEALLGITSQKATAHGSSISANNFPDNLVPTLNAGQVTGGSTSQSEWSLVSYLARVNYGYKDKYFLTGTVRKDGSSRFGDNNKWGYFPSVSLGWIASREDFIKNLSFISYLKLRTSYGVSGNNAIPNYGSVGLLSYADYVIGGNVLSGLVPSTLSNADLGWETAKQFDLGLEAAFLKDRIKLTFDAYQTINDDILLEVPVPSILGVTSALQNIGKVRNRGLELSLQTQNLTGALRWETAFNISFNRNVVLALGPEGDPIRSRSNQESNITQIGRPIGDFYGYIFEGVYNTQEEIDNHPSLATDVPGDPIVKDVNGDGEITVDDRTVLGNYQPDFYYGFQNTFAYKNFDLSIFIQGVEGAEIMSLGMRQSMSMSGRTNNLGLARERWRSPEEPGNGTVFSASADIRGVRRNPSSFYMQDGSYLRVRNITVGYNFDQKLVEKVGIVQARVYVASQNPFTSTDYPGYNPEVSSYHNSLTPGVDYFNYPLAKTLTFGVNLTF